MHRPIVHYVTYSIKTFQLIVNICSVKVTYMLRNSKLQQDCPLAKAPQGKMWNVPVEDFVSSEILAKMFES